jgi:hypothetical protein
LDAAIFVGSDVPGASGSTHAGTAGAPLGAVPGRLPDGGGRTLVSEERAQLTDGAISGAGTITVEFWSTPIS